MTEKRFTITQDFEEHHRQIRDNGHIIMGCFLEAQAEPIVKLLNELVEEKEICENEIARLQLIITKVKDKDYDNYTKKIQELSEENKELKNELNLSKLKFHKMYMEQIEENKELKEILKHTYEIHECETCKHNESFNWLDPATMNREYDSRCSKGLHYDDEVHGCEKYELDLEMFKKRVKR